MPLLETSNRVLSKVEFVLLACFLVALPIAEAPKNLFLVFYELSWLINSIRSRNFGFLPRIWDVLFAALLIFPIFTIFFSSPYPHVWIGMGDIATYLLLGWTLARSRLDEQQVFRLFCCAIGSTLLGIVQGYYVLAVDPKRIWLQLNAVGHVNHSALFCAGIGIMAAAINLMSWHQLSSRQRWLSSIVTLACFAGMIAFASRGAFVAYVAGMLLIVTPYLFLHMRRTLLVGVSALALAICVAFITQGLIWMAAQQKNTSSLVQKTMDNVRSHDVTSARGQLARTAIEMWRQKPVLGVGVNNFSAVSPEMVQSWLAERNESFEPSKFLFSNHAHNVYFNTLAERGTLGEILLLALGLGWAWELWRKRPAIATPTVLQLCWAAGVAGWAVVFVGGLFNTTLHHGHGMLSMFGLGLLLGSAWPQRTMENR